MSKANQDFVTSLLSQDELFGSSEFSRHRQQLLQTIARAEARERRARWITAGAWAASTLVFTALFLLNDWAAGRVNLLPEWVFLAAGLLLFLPPLASFILLLMYLLGPLRNLNRLKHAAQRDALLELPREIAELKRQISRLQQPAPEPPVAEGTKPHGFTLMELLMVVGVIALLAALLMPSLAQAKSRAQRIACLNNLAQMSKALANYEGEYHFYPGAGDAVTLTNEILSIAPNSWRARLMPFLQQPGTFRCPAHQPHEYRSATVDSYGYNATGTDPIHTLGSPLGLGDGKAHFVRSTQVAATSEMIALRELELPPGLWMNLLSPVAEWGKAQTFIASRHESGALMAFCDGHVEWQKQQRWVARSSAVRARWNRDAQPHPETWPSEH